MNGGMTFWNFMKYYLWHNTQEREEIGYDAWKIYWSTHGISWDRAMKRAMENHTTAAKPAKEEK